MLQIQKVIPKQIIPPPNKLHNSRDQRVEHRSQLSPNKIYLTNDFSSKSRQEYYKNKERISSEMGISHQSLGSNQNTKRSIDKPPNEETTQTKDLAQKTDTHDMKQKYTSKDETGDLKTFRVEPLNHPSVVKIDSDPNAPMALRGVSGVLTLNQTKANEASEASGILKAGEGSRQL